jgi:hypothetical protein
MRTVMTHLLVFDLRLARVGPHTLYHEHYLNHATLVGCEMLLEAKLKFCIWKLCFVILETFAKDPFAHRLASPNAKIELSNEEKATLNVSLRNKMREIFAKDKSAPTNARKRSLPRSFPNQRQRIQK